MTKCVALVLYDPWLHAPCIFVDRRRANAWPEATFHEWFNRVYTEPNKRRYYYREARSSTSEGPYERVVRHLRDQGLTDREIAKIVKNPYGR